MLMSGDIQAEIKKIHKLGTHIQSLGIFSFIAIIVLYSLEDLSGVGSLGYFSHIGFFPSAALGFSILVTFILIILILYGLTYLNRFLCSEGITWGIRLFGLSILLPILSLFLVSFIDYLGIYLSVNNPIILGLIGLLIIGLILGPMSFIFLINEIRKIGVENNVKEITRPALFAILAILVLIIISIIDMTNAYTIAYFYRPLIYMPGLTLVTIIFEILLIISIIMIGKGFYYLSEKLRDSILQIPVEELKDKAHKTTLQQAKELAREYNVPPLLVLMLKTL